MPKTRADSNANLDRPSLAVILPLLQFSTAAIIVVSTRWTPLTWTYLLPAAAGLVISVWSWIVMGRGRLTMSVASRPHSSLVVNGPYRFTRHPMYSGLLLLCLGSLLSHTSVWRIATLVVLAVTLDIKARVEERLLIATFPEYADYLGRSWRFLPPVY